MVMETDCFKQFIVLWAASTPDGFGRTRVIDPVELNVRWELKRGETTAPTGNTIAYDLSVYCGQDIAEGSIIWMGELQDVPDSPTPLYRCIALDHTPDIKARNVRRAARFVRYTETLPELV